MRIKITGLKMRVMARHFVTQDGNEFIQKWTIELNIQGRKWLPLGDENGEIRMDSEKEATDRMNRIRVEDKV